MKLNLLKKGFLLATGLLVGASAWGEHPDSGTYETNLTTATGTVGDTDLSSNFWNAHSMEYSLVDNGTYTIEFTNHGGTSQWNNFVLVINNGTASYNYLGGTEYVVLRADNYGWGTYYNSENFTNTFAQPDGSTAEYWADYATALQEANVVMKISRSGTTISMTATITPTNTNYSAWTYGWSNTIDAATGDVGFEFTTDKSYMVITSASQTVKTVVNSWDFVTVGKSKTDKTSISTTGSTVKINNVDCSIGKDEVDGLAFQGSWIFRSAGYLYSMNNGTRTIGFIELKAGDIISITKGDQTLTAVVNCTLNGDGTFTVTSDGNVGITISNYGIVYSITVTREVEAGTCEDPTYKITAADGTNRKFTLACETSGATIYYSETEKAIGDEGWTTYSSEVSTAAETIWAYAATSDANSEVISFATGAGSSVTLNAPTLSKTAYANNNYTVSITSAQSDILGTPIATIMYSIDGGEAQTYSAAISVSEGSTVTAYATATGYTQSANATLATAARPADLTQVWTQDYTNLVTDGTGIKQITLSDTEGGDFTVGSTAFYNITGFTDTSLSLNTNVGLNTASYFYFRTNGNNSGILKNANNSGSTGYIGIQNLLKGDQIVITTNGNSLNATSGVTLEEGMSTTSEYIFTATATEASILFNHGTYNYVKTITVNRVATVSATISSAGWATLYTDYALDFSSLSSYLTAYTATCNGSTVTLTEVENIPAGTGVVLKGKADTYSIPVIASSSTDKGSLKGSTTENLTYSESADYDYYMLAMNSSNEAQFTKLTSGTITAGKAYLALEKSSGARTLRVVFAGEATGISQMEDGKLKKEDSVYNLNGQRVMQPAKGLYIVNGQKIIMK